MSLKNKNKNNYIPKRLTKTKLLVLGSLLFSLGIGTGVTATYAWYSLKEISSIQNLNLSIDAKKDTFLKLHLETDEGLIHKEEGYTKKDLGIEGKELTDVSGMFQSTWLNENTDAKTAKPVLRTSYRTALGNYKDPGETTEKDVFVQNVFYFEAGMDCTVYLSSDSYISANQEENLKVAELKHKDVDKLNNVAHSVRTSFYTEDNYIVTQPNENNYETLYGGVLDLNVDGYYDYQQDENGNEKETLYGEYTGSPSYNGVGDANAPYSGDDASTFKSSHKQGVQKVDASSVDIKKENAKRMEEVSYIVTDPSKETYVSDLMKNQNATPLCKVRRGELKRIVVSVYVEGWDKYMTDDIASACFDINISFTALFNDPFNE